MVLAQLLNTSFADQQLALISYERDYPVGQCKSPYIFQYDRPSKQLFVDIQYALSFKEKIGVATKGEENVQSRFGSGFVVADQQAKEFNRQISVAFANVLTNYNAALSLKQAIISFVGSKFTKAEQDGFFQLIAYAVLGRHLVCEDFEPATRNYFGELADRTKIETLCLQVTSGRVSSIVQTLLSVIECSSKSPAVQAVFV